MGKVNKIEVEDYQTSKGKTRWKYVIELEQINKIRQTPLRQQGFTSEIEAYEAAILAKKEHEENVKLLNREEITFQNFYEKIWWGYYVSGTSGRTSQVPSTATKMRTKDLFRLHLLPMFGKYPIKWLNNNKKFVLETLVEKSQTFANIKTLKSYINQVFGIAELLEYIEYNQIDRILSFVSDPKKQKLAEERELSGKNALTAAELNDWIAVVNREYEEGILPMSAYVYFWIILTIGDRTSETRALQWKHIDFDNKYIYLLQSISVAKELKSTKGGKRTKFEASPFVLSLLKKWKIEQANELAKIGIEQNGEQYLFTYCNNSGEINVPVHIDWFQYKLTSIERRNPELTHAHPHKLRHTFSTLAREGGAATANISEALTHSDLKTTEIYINTPNVIDLSVYQSLENRLEQEKKSRIENSQSM
jgi:integrase